MSKKITIPKSVGYPYATFDVNGKLYKYNSGAEVDVEDEVAEIVEDIIRNERKGGKIPYGQADYLQPDPMAASYIRNRPFYDEYKDIEVLKKATLNCDSDGYAQISDALATPGNGDKCTVYFDGVAYDCVSIDPYDDGTSIVGNASFYDASYENTGEPFYFYRDTGECYFWANSSGSHEVSIIQCAHIYHKIGVEYMPVKLKQRNNSTGKYEDVTGELILQRDPAEDDNPREGLVKRYIGADESGFLYVVMRNCIYNQYINHGIDISDEVSDIYATSGIKVSDKTGLLVRIMDASEAQQDIVLKFSINKGSSKLIETCNCIYRYINGTFRCLGLGFDTDGNPVSCKFDVGSNDITFYLKKV